MSPLDLDLARDDLLNASLPSIRRTWAGDRAAGRTGLIYFVVDLNDARAPEICGHDYDGMRVTQAQVGPDDVAWFFRATPNVSGILEIFDERLRDPIARSVADGKLVVIAFAGNEGYRLVVEALDAPNGRAIR